MKKMQQKLRTNAMIFFPPTYESAECALLHMEDNSEFDSDFSACQQGR
jgi:hypothetical protein